MKEIRNEINLLLEKSYAIRINNLNESINLTNKALGLCNENKIDDLKARSLTQLSLYYMITGKNEIAYNLSLKSIKLFEKLGDEKGIADAKYNIAGFYYKTNNFQMGVVYLIDALIVYKNLNDYHNISKCEKSLATVYDFTGDIQKAIQSLKNAVNAAKKVKELNLESNAYNNLSGIYIKKNQIQEATNYILKSIEIKQKTKDVRGLGFAIYGRGKVYFAQKKYTEAIADFNEAIAIHSEMGEKLGLVMAYTKLAKLYFEINDIEMSKKNARDGLDITNSFNISMIKIKLLHLFYTIYKTENNIDKTLEYLEYYVKEKESVLNAQNIKTIENYDFLVKMRAMQKEAQFQQEKAIILAKSNKAEESARIRQEFLSTMSHEIRTPLNAITTITTLLNENTKPEDSILLDSLKFSSNHLMQIVNNILDYTKLDLGKMSLDLKLSNLKSLLENFWNANNFQAKEKGIKFKLKIDNELHDYYYYDETKMSQILGNLVNNSLKFTDVGSIKLEVKVVNQSYNYDTLLFKISDTGIGIEKENIDKVFESFSQVRTGTTRKKDGTGLGLSITKKLIELHGSTINIQSKLESGSLFFFELKLKKSKNTEENKQVNFENNINGLKVLLVEDNAINAMIALKLLSRWGIVTDHAKDGLEATNKSQNIKYDYILMDIHMPVLDGYQAAKNIRTLPNMNQETPIFGLTADIAAKENEQFNFYFTDFLMKPLEIEKLNIALSSL